MSRLRSFYSGLGLSPETARQDEEISQRLTRKAHELAHMAGGPTILHITADESEALARAYAGDRILRLDFAQQDPTLGDLPTPVVGIETPHGTVSLNVRPVTAERLAGLPQAWRARAKQPHDQISPQDPYTLGLCADELDRWLAREGRP